MYDGGFRMIIKAQSTYISNTNSQHSLHHLQLELPAACWTFDMRGLSIFGLVAVFASAGVLAFNFNDNKESIVEGPYPIEDDESYPVVWRRANNNSAPRCRYPGFNQSAATLEKGSIRRKGARPLLSDIYFERDVPVQLRDGVVIYVDVFRPTHNEPAPTIISWSPYGKEVGGQWLDDVSRRSGVSLAEVSEIQKFEGADPAYWVAQGYAVINPDARGSYMSGGNQTAWGTQLGKDGYDVVEWVAAQPWSNGKVGFSGNSYLAMSQWFIAAQQPPHLFAIAPWEGDPDIYRHSAYVGGIPSVGFQEGILTTYCGLDLVEDTVRMTLREPLITPYWQDKIARMDKIKVPAYVVASYTNTAHTLGTFEGWQGLTSNDKWLRAHNSSEWPDYYDQANVEDLKRFFDHFLKDIENDWLDTPRVRNAILNPGGSDILDQVASDWPPPDVEPTYLYPRSDLSLDTCGSTLRESTRYDVNGTANVSFNFTIQDDFDLIGFSRARLWVEAVGSRDMDIEVSIQKLAANGSVYSLPAAAESVQVIAASGRQRISKRHTDGNQSNLYQPHYTFDRLDFIKPGEIVPVDVSIWPMGLRFTTGEVLRITVSAWTITPPHDLGIGVAQVPVPAEGGTFPQGRNAFLQELGGTALLPAYVNLQEVNTPTSPNKGAHVFHFGGEYDSYFLIPTRSLPKKER
jgi:predicted acyl esterase